jgi:hypothetical protein
MNLTEKQKNLIKEHYHQSLVHLGMEIDEVVEDTLDYLIDESYIDLSEDEDGDLYESYNNLVWDYVEEELMS